DWSSDVCSSDLDHAELLDVFGHLLEEALTDLLVGDLAPAEHDGDARLVALLQEPADVTDLDLVIVLIGLRPQLDLLELDDDLLFARFRGLLLGLVLVLAVVHDLADGGPRRRRDLDQVETLLFRLGEGDLRRHDPELRAIGGDQAHFTCADAPVRPCVPNESPPPYWRLGRQ